LPICPNLLDNHPGEAPAAAFSRRIAQDIEFTV
jgi:hypothetical protein